MCTAYVLDTKKIYFLHSMERIKTACMQKRRDNKIKNVVDYLDIHLDPSPHRYDC